MPRGTAASGASAIQPHKAAVFRRLAAVYLLTAFGKLIGFFRIREIAQTFGASSETDSVLLALGCVLVWDSVVVSGAVAVSGIAILEAGRDGSGSILAGARRLGNLAAATFIVSAVVSAGLWAGAPQLTSALAPGFGPDAHALTTRVFRILAALPFLAVGINVPALIHQIEGRLGLYAASGLLTSAIPLLYLWTLPLWRLRAQDAILGLAAITIVGYGVAMALQIGGLRSAERRAFRSGLGRPSFDALVSDVGPVAFGVAFQELGALFSLTVASLAYPGSVAVLTFADRLPKLVVAMIASPALVVLYPRWAAGLTQLGAQQSLAQIRRDLIWAFTMITPLVAVLVVAPASVLAVVYHPLPALTDRALSDLTSLTVVLSLGLIPSVGTLVFSRLLVTLQGAPELLRATSSACAVQFVTAPLLLEAFGLLGVGAASVLATFFQGVLLLRALRSRGLALGLPTLLGGARWLACFLAAAGAAVAALSILPWPRVGLVVAGSAACVGALAVGWIVRHPGARELTSFAAAAAMASWRRETARSSGPVSRREND